MDNKTIVKQLKQTAQLLELHGENPFKVRGYTSAVFNLEKIDTPLAEIDHEALLKLEGVGKSIAEGIRQMIPLGILPALQELLDRTPNGVIDMMDIKGIGPKKIRTIWQELGIETIDELLQATEKNQIAELKGFGAKTQETIKQGLLYKRANAGKLHYVKAEPLAEDLAKGLTALLPDAQISITGHLRRCLETIGCLEVLVGTSNRSETINLITGWDRVTIDTKASGPFTLAGTWQTTQTPIAIYLCDSASFAKELLLTSSAPQHTTSPVVDGKTLRQILANQFPESEKAAYQLAKLDWVAPELREGTFEIGFAAENKLPKLVEMGDLKGILHNHSTYSDGKHTLRQMAEACKEMGYEYLGISDHSKSAFYANGLDENRIVKQHEEIEVLNSELAPFRVFKGIESDILNDGALDYSDEILSSFDFIVASIHSTLNMSKSKATERLVTAIANPHTTMLGHPTGRLLLRREGYPIDHQTIIDACAEFGVVIEINANPWRLDLDWRWVHNAIEKGVMLAINPDAHEIQGYRDMRYGLLTGRKGGLTADMTFNAKSVEEIAKHFESRKLALSK